MQRLGIVDQFHRLAKLEHGSFASKIRVAKRQFELVGRIGSISSKRNHLGTDLQNRHIDLPFVKGLLERDPLGHDDVKARRLWIDPRSILTNLRIAIRCVALRCVIDRCFLGRGFSSRGFSSYWARQHRPANLDRMADTLSDRQGGFAQGRRDETTGLFVLNAYDVFGFVCVEPRCGPYNQPLHRHAQQWIDQDRHEDQRDQGPAVAQTLSELFEAEPTESPVGHVGSDGTRLHTQSDLPKVVWPTRSSRISSMNISTRWVLPVCSRRSPKVPS